MNKELISNFIRDFCAVGKLRAKSEVRRRLNEILKSQRKEIVENVKDVRDRVFEHRGENKQLDESINGLAGVIFEEIINLIKEDE